jgi:hypothetical protein
MMDDPERPDPTANPGSSPNRRLNLPTALPQVLRVVPKAASTKAALLALLAGLFCATMFVHYVLVPYVLVYAIFVLILLIGALRLPRLTGLTALYVVAAAVLASTLLVTLSSFLVNSALGYPDAAWHPLFSFVKAVVRGLGWAGIALAIISYFDPAFRSELVAAVTVGNGISPARAVVVVALLSTAVYAVPRAISGSKSFGIAASWSQSVTRDMSACFGYDVEECEATEVGTTYLVTCRGGYSGAIADGEVECGA